MGFGSLGLLALCLFVLHKVRNGDWKPWCDCCALWCFISSSEDDDEKKKGADDAASPGGVELSLAKDPYVRIEADAFDTAVVESGRMDDLDSNL